MFIQVNESYVDENLIIMRRANLQNIIIGRSTNNQNISLDNFIKQQEIYGIHFLANNVINLESTQIVTSSDIRVLSRNGKKGNIYSKGGFIYISYSYYESF